jgi:antitoxin PrlF
MPVAKLSSKSQIVVPAEVRRSLDLSPGDTVVLEVVGDHAILRRRDRSVVSELAELGGDLWKGYADELQRARDEWDL